MVGYSIEAVLDEIAQSPERDFLSGYPCVNGMELSGLADRAGFVDEFKEAVLAKPQPPQCSCDPKTIQALQRLVESLPVKLGDVTSALPDLCKAAVGPITNFGKWYTVKSYFSILEDTLVGFYLPAYAGSERKRLKSAPKFYLFDNGVMRALAGQVDYPLVPGSSEYGVAFEQFVIAELTRRMADLEIDTKFSFLATKGGAEIDLVIGQGKRAAALVEIQSTNRVSVTDDLQHLRGFSDDFKKVLEVCLYTGDIALEHEGILILPWREGIERIVDSLTQR